MRALLLVLVSCAHAETIAPAPIYRATISIQQLPVAEIRGSNALVDTGASVHGVRANVGLPRARIVDASGNPLSAIPLAKGPVDIPGPWYAVSGLSVPVVVSPQAMLLPGQAIELDFPNASLGLHDDPKIASALVARADANASACQGLFFLDAIVAGEKTRMLVDSGSARTTLSIQSTTTQRIRKWPNYPAKLQGTDAWVVLQVPIAIGHSETSVDLVVTKEPRGPCDTLGAIGMDVLKSCKVVVMRASAGITCTQ